MKFAPYFLAIVGFAFAQFNATFQEAVLKFHNDLRSSIAKGTFTAKGKLKPPAANMLKMKWDRTLAVTAQKFTDACQIRHSGIRTVGENIFFAWYSDAPDLNSFGTIAPKDWASEFQSGWESNKFEAGTLIYHATQTVWAKTNLIGCGVTNCGKNAPYADVYMVFVMCQYSPPGDWVNQDIYQAGATCSACPSGYKCETDTGLCV